MLELIFIIWLISRIFRPRWGYRPFYRPYYRPFFGLGWGLPLFGLFMADRWSRRPMDHGPYGHHGPQGHYGPHYGPGPEGFGQPHDGEHGFGGSEGWR